MPNAPAQNFRHGGRADVTILEVVRRFPGRRVTVVGDVMLDHFVVSAGLVVARFGPAAVTADELSAALAASPA